MRQMGEDTFNQCDKKIEYWISRVTYRPECGIFKNSIGSLK